MNAVTRRFNQTGIADGDWRANAIDAITGKPDLAVLCRTGRAWRTGAAWYSRR